MLGSSLRVFAAAAFVIALVSPAQRAFAAGPAQVLSAKVDGQPGGSAIVIVQFGGPVPKYSVIGNGSAEISLILPDTNLAPTVQPVIPGGGSVTSVGLTQTGASSTILLRLTVAASVQVRSSGNAIAINVPMVGGAAAGGLLGIPGLLTPPAAGTGLGEVTEIVNLKYADISEIAGILVQGSTVPSNDNFEPASTNIGTGSIGGSLGGLGGIGGGGISSPQNFGSSAFGGASNGLAQRVNENIAVDRRLNAIILTGPRELVAQLKAVIQQIDVPVRSVILECEIVELTDSASKDIGVDFDPQGVLGGASYKLQNLTTGMGSLSLAANIYGQVIKGEGKILAKPRILAQSGTSASILTGDAIPIVTAVVIGTGAAVTSNQVNYINVGVSLQIQPRVSDDGFVTSHIYSEVSSVTGESQTYPQISQRQATTAATVKDGESFVIGGLLQDDELKSYTKLPFVGDLPIIGSLFGHTTTSRTQSNLYIVVTPHIVGNYSAPPAQQMQIPVNAAPPSTPKIPTSSSPGTSATP